STSLIKWVNDIYLNDRKVCGILTEAHLPNGENERGSVVVGIGINVYEPDGGFPEGIVNKAGFIISAEKADEKAAESADEIPGKNPGLRSKLAAEAICNFFHYLERQDESLKIYREKSNLIGERIMINSFSGDNVPLKHATVLGIDDDCGLIVKYEDGTTKVLSSGEVSVVKE
ncbi:MAG: hypothetical protein K6E63_03215, partial [Lachnospiraceae bacterium]|nr:hypothetical protein [Lachnospiraceae bacterium]